MNPELYIDLKKKVIEAGYAKEVDWAYDISECLDPIRFYREYCWVVLNSGMKEQIARQIWNKINQAWDEGKTAYHVFFHIGKASAIEDMRKNHNEHFLNYQKAEDKLGFLQTLPYIGQITKYHLAKNLGFQCIKPDRHLVRIAKSYNTTPEEMCKSIQDAVGDKLTVIDTVIWRSANLGFI